MKLSNKSKAFEITFNGTTHDIPTGDFEVTDKALGLYIEDIAKKWGYEVEIIEDIPDVVEVKPEVVKQEVKLEKEPKGKKKEEEVLSEPVKKATGATSETVPKK